MSQLEQVSTGSWIAGQLITQARKVASLARALFALGAASTACDQEAVLGHIMNLTVFNAGAASVQEFDRGCTRLSRIEPNGPVDLLYRAYNQELATLRRLVDAQWVPR